LTRAVRAGGHRPTESSQYSQTLVPAIEARIKAIDKAGVDALEKNGGQPDARVVENAKCTHSQKTVRTVVISPTRELAMQIAHEATKLTHWHKGFGVKVFTGGSSKGLQPREFKFGRKLSQHLVAYAMF
jgi:ATP-dependent RNA helicase MSS116